MDWALVATIAGSAAVVIISFIGGVYKINKDIYSSADKVRQELNASFKESSKESREDINRFEERMAINDQRWSVLFSRFHDLDKDMEKFKISNV